MNGEKMQRSPIYYPKGAGFDGAILRALYAAVANVGRILVLSAAVLTVSSWSLEWILHLELWAFCAALVAAFWCIAMLYEWRCRRRRKERTRSYRFDLQEMALKQKPEA
jgi:cyanate permease